MADRIRHIFLLLVLGMALSGCNIYSDIDELPDCDVYPDKMHVSFNISAGSPESLNTRALSYDNPVLEDGTEWENYVNIANKDYLFYLFDKDDVFQEILQVTDISKTDNSTYKVSAELRGIYSDFTIVALINWGTDAWVRPSGGPSYPVLTKGVSTVEDIWQNDAGLRVYNSSSNLFTPSETGHIPMYGAKTFSSKPSSGILDLGTFYLIRSLAKVDVYVDEGSNISLEDVQLNCFSNSFNCAPVAMKSIDDTWDQASDETINLSGVTYSPSSLDFARINDNLYRLYIPEYPNGNADLQPATISVMMLMDGSYVGGTILFEGKQTTSSTGVSPLNILRNSYYKFHIKAINKYETNVDLDVVPFDNVSNNLEFE